MMQEIGVDSFYNNKWAAFGSEIVNHKWLKDSLGYIIL